MPPTLVMRDGLAIDYDQVLIPHGQLRVQWVFPFGRLKAPDFVRRIGRLGRLEVKYSVKLGALRTDRSSSRVRNLPCKEAKKSHATAIRHWLSMHPASGAFVRTERAGMEREAPIRVQDVRLPVRTGEEMIRKTACSCPLFFHYVLRRWVRNA